MYENFIPIVDWTRKSGKRERVENLFQRLKENHSRS